MQGMRKGKRQECVFWSFHSQWQENFVLDFNSFGLIRIINIYIKIFPLTVESEKELIFKSGAQILAFYYRVIL